MGHSYKEREKKKAHTHITLTYADNTFQTCTLAQRAQSSKCIENTHTHTWVLRWKQGSLRVNEVETQGP